MDKTPERTLFKTSLNTKLPTCDDKGVFTDDDDTCKWCGGGGCDMGLLSDFSLASLISE
jgi:hypothetical protein